MSTVGKKATAFVTAIELNDAETQLLIALLKDDERDSTHTYAQRHLATSLGGQLRNVASQKTLAYSTPDLGKAF